MSDYTNTLKEAMNMAGIEGHLYVTPDLISEICKALQISLEDREPLPEDPLLPWLETIQKKMDEINRGKPDEI